MNDSKRFVGIILMIIGVGVVCTDHAGAAGVLRKKSKSTKTTTVTSDQHVYHTVRRGQTLYSIAREYGIPLKTLSAVNGIANPASIKTGTRLMIPGSRKRSTKTARVIAPPAVTMDQSPARPPLEERVFLTAPLSWPVEGPVVSAFARPRRGHKHKGIDIKSDEGAPVRAVADGTVIRVEERIGSYGRLIVIEHENGMLSYYGHNKQNLVQLGQTVSAEETIGLVGHSGNATCDHLHFELHVRGQAVDPLPILASLPKGPVRDNPREPIVTAARTPKSAAAPASSATRR